MTDPLPLLREALAAVAKATPGDWHAEESVTDAGGRYTAVMRGPVEEIAGEVSPSASDAAAIVAAVNWMREHGEEVAALLARLAGEGCDEPHWARVKPVLTGVYGVRGFNLFEEPEDQFEAVVLVKRDGHGVLVCNLHESTSEADLDRWYPVDDLDDRFEWCGFTFAPPALAPAPKENGNG